jgi:hypothetical protein
MEPATSAGLAAARELDGASRHAEAYSLLAEASRQGELPAMSELGHRLLVADRAPWPTWPSWASCIAARPGMACTSSTPTRT